MSTYSAPEPQGESPAHSGPSSGQGGEVGTSASFIGVPHTKPSAWHRVGSQCLPDGWMGGWMGCY